MSDHTEQMMLYTRLVQADPIVQELKQRYSDMIVYSLIEQASPQEPPPPGGLPPTTTVTVADPPDRECPHCATPDTYLYQGEGYWYCGRCDHDGWDEEEPTDA